MTTFSEDAARRLVPRWRFHGKNPSSAEFSGISRKPNLFAPNPQFLKEKIDDWETHRSIGTAADAVACAIVTGDLSQVKQCAQYLMEEESRTTEHVQWLAKYALNLWNEPQRSQRSMLSPLTLDETKSMAIAAAQVARSRLRKNPRNLLAQIDLSLAYTILGQSKHAINAMENALRLEPFHRYVLRSAARLFIHADKHNAEKHKRNLNRAHALLVGCKRTKSDPWLMAAEISTAIVAERSPRYIRNARDLVERRNLPLEHLSELYGALGTLHCQDNKLKQARKSFQKSLEKPTDNVVAQASWANKELLINLNISESAWEVPCTFEAQCWEAYQKGQWEKMVITCRDWLSDEPFSIRPAQLGSCIGIGFTENYQFAEICARIGLMAEPNNHALLNNLAVALAYQEKLDDAKEEFNKIRRSSGESYPEYVYLATQGLLCFRDGNVTRGRQLYEQAEDLASGKGKALVIIHRAKEEKRAKTEMAGQVCKTAYGYANKSRDKEVQRRYELLVAKEF